MIYSGSLVTLFLRGDQKWEIIGGVRNIKLEINAPLVENSNHNSGPWRMLQDEAGIRCVNITGNGVFTSNIAEQMIQELALSGKKARYKIVFADNKKLEGEFLISYYQRYCHIDNEENYILTLSSSGKISESSA